MKFESSVKEIAFSQASVYDKLSNLSNLQAVIDKLKEGTGSKEQVAGGALTEEQMQMVMSKLDSVKIDADSLTVEMPVVGEVGMTVVEREPAKCVKFASTKSPIGFKLWIQVVATSDTTSKLRITVDADVNPFMAMMVQKPLKEGVEKIADMLGMANYGI